VAVSSLSETQTTSASHAGGADSMSVDMDPSASPANTGTTFGTVETCARVNENDTLDADEDSVDTLRVDAIIDNIPATNPAITTSFVLTFPGGGTEFTVSQVGTPFATAAGWSTINTTDSPQTDGTFFHGVSDLFVTGTDGSGAIGELTLETIAGVSTGTFPLDLTQMAHIDTDGNAQIPDSVVGAEVAVNQSCPQPPADVEILSLTLTSISGPTIDVGTNFDLEAEATAQNNGPNPADIEIDIDLSIPADCTRVPNSNQTEGFSNVLPAESRNSTLTWTVNCSQPSDHAFSASASANVTGLADESNFANNGPINQPADVAIVGDADPKITAVTVSAPTDAATGGPFTVTVEATLHNNGPITPVNTDVTYDLTVPAGCTRDPDNTQLSDDVSLAQSAAVLEQRSWTVTCTTTGLKTFDGSATLALDQLHVTDLNGTNNSGQGQASTDTSLGVADVKVTSVSVTSAGPANINTPFGVTVNSLVHNNGPFSPVNADGVLTLNLPPDCFTPVELIVLEDATLDISVVAALPEVTFFVTCTDESFHDFSATLTMTMDDLNAGDPTPSNNAATSNTSTTAVLRTSDLKVSGVTAGVPVSADTDTPFDVTVDASLHNNGPDDDAPVDVEVSLSVPPDCTTPTNPITIPMILTVSIATPLATQTFPTTCTDRSLHNFEATVTLLHPLHVDDPTSANDTASSGASVVPIFDVADLKINGVTISADPQALTNTPFNVTATNDVHNNGPTGPTNADLTATLNLPPDCTTTDSNPQTAEDVGLPTSAATNVDVVWAVTCTSPSFHSFSADSSLVIDDLHVQDPNSGNDVASSPNTDIAVSAPTDGKIVAAITVSPPASIIANADVNITIRKELHNNGPLGPTDFDLTKSITPPAGCTVTPPATSSHTLAVSVTLSVDEVWTINCQAGSYTLTFVNQLTPTELHVLDTVAANDTSVLNLNVFVDTDGDNFPDDVEVACGSDPNNGSSIPERVDGVFAGADDDLDSQTDEPLPAGATSFDCDGDGYAGSDEDHVYAPSTQGDQDPCGSNAFPTTNPPTPIGWPADLRAGGVPDSTNRVTIFDITSFLAPVKSYNTNVGTNPGDFRWDLVPGAGPFLFEINIADLVNLIIVSPQMLGGVKAFNGPPCPSPP